MKYLLSSLFLIFFSFSTHAAVGWFYTDDLAAIASALETNKSFAFRGSYLEAIEKTKMGYKVKLSGGCVIALDKVMPRSVGMRPHMTGPNPEIRLMVNTKKSFCSGK